MDENQINTFPLPFTLSAPLDGETFSATDDAEQATLGAAVPIRAFGIANLVPKQADTMPSMVGALVGGAHGTSAIPETWRIKVERLRGYGVPSTDGVRLRDLAEQLVTAVHVAS